MREKQITGLLLLFAIFCLLVACTISEPTFEPGTGGEESTPATTPIPPTIEPTLTAISDPATTTPAPPMDEISLTATSEMATARPDLVPIGPATATPAPSMDEISLTATSEMATAHPELVPIGPVTPTPVPPSPGAIYQTTAGLWQIGDDWQPRFLSPFAEAVLSPDNTRLVYADQGDLWLTTLAEGTTTQLTNTPDHSEHYPQWWPAHPDILLFQSYPLDAQAEGPQARGYLAAMSLSEGWLTLLERDELSWEDFAPSPNGLHIAFDRGGEPWLYHWDLETAEPFHEDTYSGSQAVTWERLGSPSWSSDGNKLAWVAAVQGEAYPAANGSWQIAAAIFDLTNSTFTILHPYDNVGRGGWYAAAVWSPDDQWLAFTTEDVDPARQGVWVLKTDGSEEHHLSNGYQPVWSPDGQWLAYQGVTPWMVQTTTWYALNLFVYENGLIVDWR